MLHTTPLRTLRSALAFALVGIFGCGGTAPGGGTHAQGMLLAHWTAPDVRSEEVPISFEAENPKTDVMFTTLGKGGEHFRGSYARVRAAVVSRVGGQ